MRWLILFIPLFFIACGADTENDHLSALENAYEAEPTDDQFLELLNGYYEEIMPDPKTPEAKKVMVRAAEFSAKIDRKNAAIGFLNTLVKEFYDDEETPERVAELASYLDELGKNKASEMLKRCFIRAFDEHPLAGSFRNELDDPEMPLDTFITQLGLSMFTKDNKGIDPSVARAYVDACEAYALVLPKDPKAVDYLQKGSEMARTLNDIEKALSLYDWIINEYPQHPKAPQALFLKAFTFDNNLKDYENARKYYEEFLERYPDDDFADDTKFLLQNLGKSDEEILQQLQE